MEEELKQFEEYALEKRIYYLIDEDEEEERQRGEEQRAHE